MASPPAGPTTGRRRLSPAGRLPVASFRLWRRYFRYEVEGFEVLTTTEPSLIVGYHGGAWPFDLFLLGTRIYDELGYFPRAPWHWMWFRIPVVKHAVSGLRAFDGVPTDAEIAELKARGEHVVVAPGGTREALRPFWRRYRVDFGPRDGYLKLARAHDLPIVPVVASGVDSTFFGLNDGRAMSKRLFGRSDFPAWIGLGLGGAWPLALPFPTKIRQRVGRPIRLDADEPLDVAHARVTGTMQLMLDTLRRDQAS